MAILNSINGPDDPPRQSYVPGAGVVHFRPPKKKEDKTVRETSGEKKPLISRISDMVMGENFRERVVNSVYPYGYSEGMTSLESTKRGLGEMFGSFFSEDALKTSQRLDLSYQGHRNRYDAWRMYSNLKQKYGTFIPSDTRPTTGKDAKNPRTTYYRFSDPKAEARYLQAATVYGLIDGEPGKNINFADTYSSGKGNSVMNTGILGFGKDEKGYYVSYSDKWDLAPKDSIGKLNIPGLQNVFGRPFHIYNRIYISDKQLSQMRATKTRMKAVLTDSDISEKDRKKQMEQIKPILKGSEAAAKDRAGSAAEQGKSMLNKLMNY